MSLDFVWLRQDRTGKVWRDGEGPLPQSVAGASHLLRSKNSNTINVFCEGRCQRNNIPLYENSKDSGKGMDVYNGG